MTIRYSIGYIELNINKEKWKLFSHKFTITACQCHIAMSVTKSLWRSIHRFQEQQQIG